MVNRFMIKIWRYFTFFQFGARQMNRGLSTSIKLGIYSSCKISDETLSTSLAMSQTEKRKN